METILSISVGICLGLVPFGILICWTWKHRYDFERWAKELRKLAEYLSEDRDD